MNLIIKLFKLLYIRKNVYKLRWVFKSATFNVDMISFGNHADTWPTVSFHFVVVFDTGKIGNHIRSSGICGLFAIWISSSDVIST